MSQGLKVDGRQQEGAASEQPGVQPDCQQSPSRAAALECLLGRFSLGGKHLIAPAPDARALSIMTQAALRAPDHGSLVPYRFALIDDDARIRLADLFERVALASGKSAESAALDRTRALEPPLLVAVIARIDIGHPVATAHEQWMAVGGAVSNFLNAAHALGYAGKMLSGVKVRAREVIEAFCLPGETLVGWMVLGTAAHAPKARQQKPAADLVLQRWQLAVQRDLSHGA